MGVTNISKNVKGYMKIHRKHIGKTIVVHNLNTHQSMYRLQQTEYHVELIYLP